MTVYLFSQPLRRWLGVTLMKLQVEELIKVELTVSNIFEVIEFKRVISLESADDERACAWVRG